TVYQDDGLPIGAPGGDTYNGFGTVGAGTPVTVGLTNGGGASYILLSPSLTGTTDGNGQFQVTFTSASAGTVTGHAPATFLVTGGSPPRATDSTPGSSGDVIKTFVAGSLKWLKVDGGNNNAPLGGATFRVTATAGTALSNSPKSVLVTDNDVHDA